MRDLFRSPAPLRRLRPAGSVRTDRRDQRLPGKSDIVRVEGWPTKTASSSAKTGVARRSPCGRKSCDTWRAAKRNCVRRRFAGDPRDSMRGNARRLSRRRFGPEQRFIAFAAPPVNRRARCYCSINFVLFDTDNVDQAVAAAVAALPLNAHSLGRRPSSRAQPRLTALLRAAGRGRLPDRCSTAASPPSNCR
jgi:hypothetical protein